MEGQRRREFLSDVGKGMLIAGIGVDLASDLGISPAIADDGAHAKAKLSFGAMEPLVSLIQETPPEKLLPLLVQRLAKGMEHKELVCACALANARTFGGHDYDGYHSFMALGPSLHMASELDKPRAALPVLKVVYRNAAHMQTFGGCKRESLHELHSHESAEVAKPEALRDAARQLRRDEAEAMLAAAAARSPEDAFNHALYCVHDDVDVHRVVLAWRAWSTLELTGRDQALTLLRQSVRFCIDSEKYGKDRNRPTPGVRTTLPKLLDRYALLSKPAGTRRADDSWILKLANAVYAGSREAAADATAQALAEGFALEDIGEAISLAANRLVLCDKGRTRAEKGKPIGSVHGASLGVHASDAANAWRNIARASNLRNSIASLIVGAYHTGGQSGYAGPDEYPWKAHLDAVKAKDGAGLLKEADHAIRAGNQALAAATVQRYAALGIDAKPVFQLLLQYATSQDGALHAEKYYRTVTEEFAAARPAFKWRHLVALARVTASEHGFPAPGYDQACSLLGV